jgi:hypothetical protein
MSELVSARLFPVLRENAGKFANFGLETAKAPRLSEGKFNRLPTEFPSRKNRENLRANRDPEAHNSETDPNIGGVCREFFRLEAKAAKFPLLSPSRKLFELVLIGCYESGLNAAQDQSRSISNLTRRGSPSRRSFLPFVPVLLVMLRAELLRKLAGRTMQVGIEHEGQAADHQAVRKHDQFDGYIAR